MIYGEKMSDEVYSYMITVLINQDDKGHGVIIATDVGIGFSISRETIPALVVILKDKITERPEFQGKINKDEINLQIIAFSEYLD